MNDLISVVVPVYNVEKYLKKCVDSIINQTYENIEILLIDDGSTDKSGKICDNYKKIDKRIKVFHKKNGGLSNARNYGIDNAHGKYICFVDSDDFITRDMCKILYDDIMDFSADVAIGTYVDCYGNIPTINNDNIERLQLTKEDAIKCVMIGEKAPISAIAKLYKKVIFNTVRFEEGKAYEDALIMIELLDKCDVVSYNSSSVYYYVHRKNSITTEKFNPKYYDVIYAYEKNLNLIEKKYPHLLEYARMRLCWANFQVMDAMVRSNISLDENVVEFLKNNTMFILKSLSFTKSRKISLLALKINKKLYVKVVKWFYSRKRTIYD